MVLGKSGLGGKGMEIDGGVQSGFGKYL